MRPVFTRPMRVALAGVLATATLVGIAAPAAYAAPQPVTPSALKAAVEAPAPAASEVVTITLPTGQTARGRRIPIPGSQVKSGIVVLDDRYTPAHGGHTVPAGGGEEKAAKAFAERVEAVVKRLAETPGGRTLLEGISRMQPLDRALGRAKPATGLPDVNVVFYRGMPDDDKKWPDSLTRKLDGAGVPHDDVKSDVVVTEPVAQAYDRDRARNGNGSEGLIAMPDEEKVFLGFQPDKTPIAVNETLLVGHELVHNAHYLQGALLDGKNNDVPVEAEYTHNSARETGKIAIPGEEVGTLGGKDRDKLLTSVTGEDGRTELRLKHFEESDKAVEKALAEPGADRGVLEDVQLGRRSTFNITETSLATELGWPARRHYGHDGQTASRVWAMPESEVHGKFLTVPAGKSVTDEDLKNPGALEKKLAETGKQTRLQSCKRFFRLAASCRPDGPSEEVTEETKKRIAEVEQFVKDHPDAQVRLPEESAQARFAREVSAALVGLRREGDVTAVLKAVAEAAGSLEKAADVSDEVRKKAKAVREKLEAAASGGKSDGGKLTEAGTALTELAGALAGDGSPAKGLKEALDKHAGLPKVTAPEQHSYEEWKKTAKETIDRALAERTKVGGEVFTPSLRDAMTSERVFNVFRETTGHLNSALGAAMTPQMVIDIGKTLASDADALTKAASLTSFTPVLGPALGLVDGIAHGNGEEAALSGVMLAGWVASQYVPAAGEIVDAGLAVYVFGKMLADEISKIVDDREKTAHWVGTAWGDSTVVDPEVVKRDLGKARDEAFHRMLTTVAQQQLRPQLEKAFKDMYQRFEQNVHASVAQIEMALKRHENEPGMAEALAEQLPKIKETAARLLTDTAQKFDTSMTEVMETNVRKIENDKQQVAEFNAKFMDAVWARGDFGNCEGYDPKFGFSCHEKKRWDNARDIIMDLPVQPLAKTGFQQWFGAAPPALTGQSLRIGVRNSTGQDLELMKADVEGQGKVIAPLPDRLAKDADQWLTLRRNPWGGDGPLRGTVTYGAGGKEKFTLRWEAADDGKLRYQVAQDASLATQVLGGDYRSRDRVSANDTQWYERKTKGVVFADITPHDKNMPSQGCRTNSGGWPQNISACMVFVNNTDQSVWIDDVEAEHGKVEVAPPRQVRPYEIVEWKTVSIDPTRGTTARTRIRAGIASVQASWENPRTGDNSACLDTGDGCTTETDLVTAYRKKDDRYHAILYRNFSGKDWGMTATVALENRPYAGPAAPCPPSDGAAWMLCVAALVRSGTHVTMRCTGEAADDLLDLELADLDRHLTDAERSQARVLSMLLGPFLLAQ